MNTARSIIFSALLLCWALLLATQTLGAAIYASGEAHTYEWGLKHIGPVVPACAWLCLGAALVVGLSGFVRKKKSDNAA